MNRVWRICITSPAPTVRRRHRGLSTLDSHDSQVVCPAPNAVDGGRVLRFRSPDAVRVPSSQPRSCAAPWRPRSPRSWRWGRRPRRARHQEAAPGALRADDARHVLRAPRDGPGCACDDRGRCTKLIDVRWEAGRPSRRRCGGSAFTGTAITARLDRAVSRYRSLRSEMTEVGGVACLRVVNGAADTSRPGPRLTLDLTGNLTTAGGGRLSVTSGRLPVVLRGSRRCAAVVPDPVRSETLPLRPLLLPAGAELGRLLHVPASAVRRGRPFDVQRSVVREQPGPAGSGTTLAQRWTLHLFFSPCTTAGC